MACARGAAIEQARGSTLGIPAAGTDAAPPRAPYPPARARARTARSLALTLTRSRPHPLTPNTTAPHVVTSPAPGFSLSRGRAERAEHGDDGEDEAKARVDGERARAAFDDLLDELKADFDELKADAACTACDDPGTGVAVTLT